MKKIVMILISVVLICLLAGCSELSEVLDDVGAIARQAQEAAPAEAEAPAQEAAPAPDAAPAQESEATPAPEPGDAQPESEPEEDTPAPALEPEELDLRDLSATDCIEDIGHEPDELARVRVDCPGAASINAEIEERFVPLLDADYCSLNYECYQYAGILSLLIVERYDGDYTAYTPYLLDLATGDRLSGSELLRLYNLDPDEVADAELTIMENEFVNLNSWFDDGGSGFYDEQYARTVDPDNVELDRLWTDDLGRVYFVAHIYGFAGAGAYEYPMLTGYSIG